MDKDAILDLLALIKAESVSLAAHSRNSSQSAYSRRLQALEHQVGSELVDRSRRPSGPTYQLKSMEVELEAALVGLNRLNDAFAIKSTEPLRIAALHSISANVLPQALAALGDALAARDMRLRSANLEACFQMLMTEEVIATFFYQTENRRLAAPKDLVHRVNLGTDVFIPVASPDYLPVLRERIDQGKALPMICFPSDTLFGDLTRSTLLPQISHNASLKILSGLTQTVTKCIERGLGVGWLPRSSAAEPMELGSLIGISDLGFPAAPIELTMMRLRTRSFAQHEKVVEAICAEMSAILARQS